MFAKDSQLPFLAEDCRLHRSACSHTCKSVPVLRHKSWYAVIQWRPRPGSRFMEAHFIRKCCFIWYCEYEISEGWWFLFTGEAIFGSSHNSRMFNGFIHWWQPDRPFITIIQPNMTGRVLPIGFEIPEVQLDFKFRKRWKVEREMCPVCVHLLLACFIYFFFLL